MMEDFTYLILIAFALLLVYFYYNVDRTYDSFGMESLEEQLIRERKEREEKELTRQRKSNFRIFLKEIGIHI